MVKIDCIYFLVKCQIYQLTKKNIHQKTIRIRLNNYTVHIMRTRKIAQRFIKKFLNAREGFNVYILRSENYAQSFSIKFRAVMSPPIEI